MYGLIEAAQGLLQQATSILYRTIVARMGELWIVGMIYRVLNMVMVCGG
jgi:hypothetical protein